MPPQPPASVELACKAMKPCMPCLANASVAAGCTTGTTSLLPLCSMPPGKRVCPAHVTYACFDRDNNDAGHSRGDVYTILSPGPGPRLQWILWLPTLATPQVFPIMPTLSKVQQQQELASKNATQCSGTACRGSRFPLSPWRAMVTLTHKLWIGFGTCQYWCCVI
jgi:hypothetical protein